MRESFGRRNDEQIREMVASILATEISDPRLALVTVTGAKVSPDRSVASVYVSAGPEEYEDVLEGLSSARGRVRALLGQRIDWRVTPEVRFFIDESVDQGERIAEALANVPPSLRDGVGATPSVEEPEDEE